MDNDVLLYDIIEYCLEKKVKLLSLNSFECSSDKGYIFYLFLLYFLPFFVGSCEICSSASRGAVKGYQAAVDQYWEIVDQQWSRCLIPKLWTIHFQYVVWISANINIDWSFMKTICQWRIFFCVIYFILFPKGDDEKKLKNRTSWFMS